LKAAKVACAAAARKRSGDSGAFAGRTRRVHPPAAWLWEGPVGKMKQRWQAASQREVRPRRAGSSSGRRRGAAYLETTKPANIPLYQRFGFGIVGEVRSGSSPLITPMFRAAR
jgi:hypothetical protein